MAMNFFQMLFESRFEEIFSFCKLIFVKARFSKFLQHKPQQIVRQPEGGWLLLEEKNPSGMFELSSLGISIAMSKLYRNVKFEGSDTEERTGQT